MSIIAEGHPVYIFKCDCCGMEDIYDENETDTPYQIDHGYYVNYLNPMEKHKFLYDNHFSLVCESFQLPREMGFDYCEECVDFLEPQFKKLIDVFATITAQKKLKKAIDYVKKNPHHGTVTPSTCG